MSLTRLFNHKFRIQASEHTTMLPLIMHTIALEKHQKFLSKLRCDCQSEADSWDLPSKLG
jgi:hypothetical protein